MNDSEFYIQIDSDNDLDNDEFYNNSLRSPLSAKNTNLSIVSEIKRKGSKLFFKFLSLFLLKE